MESCQREPNFSFMMVLLGKGATETTTNGYTASTNIFTNNKTKTTPETTMSIPNSFAYPAD